MIDTLSIAEADNEIAGMWITSGWVQDQPVYFVAQFSQPFKNLYIPEDHFGRCQFGQSDGTPWWSRWGSLLSAEEHAGTLKMISTDTISMPYTGDQEQVERGVEADRG